MTGDKFKYKMCKSFVFLTILLFPTYCCVFTHCFDAFSERKDTK